MTKLTTRCFMMLIAVACLFAVACDDDDGGSSQYDIDGNGTLDDCEKAGKIMAEGTREACGDKTDCCFCDCLLKGSSSDENCDCGTQDTDQDTGEGEYSCEGMQKTAAENCLNDEAACKNNAGVLVDGMCMF